VKNIVGARLVYWPLGQDNNGFLKNYSTVFARVHQATSTATSLSDNVSVGMDADGLVLILLPVSRWYSGVNANLSLKKLMWCIRREHPINSER